MSTKNIVIALVITLAVGIATGRYTLPAKVETVTNTSETKTGNTAVVDHSTTVTTKTIKPDGTQTTVTEVKKDIDLVKTVKDTSKASSDTVTTYHTGILDISLMAAIRPLKGELTPIYGAGLQYRAVGPLKIGCFGLADGTMGLTLGLEF